MQLWGNVDYVNSKATDLSNDGINVDYYTICAEGIYVGYKYYETRYEDAVMGSGDASSSVGSSTGNGWNYADEVVYPFGYGLSYTDFTQTLKGVTFNADTDNYEVEVEVTNTGDVAGKSVVEVYAQTPYGDYASKNPPYRLSVSKKPIRWSPVRARPSQSSVNAICWPAMTPRVRRVIS